MEFGTESSTFSTSFFPLCVFAQYRAEATGCLERARKEPNKATAERWQKIAEEWFRMADELERKIHSKPEP